MLYLSLTSTKHSLKVMVYEITVWPRSIINSDFPAICPNKSKIIHGQPLLVSRDNVAKVIMGP